MTPAKRVQTVFQDASIAPSLRFTATTVTRRNGRSTESDEEGYVYLTTEVCDAAGGRVSHGR